MRINIYQIDGEKDSRRVKFDGYEHTLKNGGIDPSIYKCTFHGYVDAQGLDDIYSIFNLFEHPHTQTYQGHSLSVSDIVEIAGDVPEYFGKIIYFNDGAEYVDPNGTTIFYTDSNKYYEDLDKARNCGRSIHAEILENQHVKTCEEGFFFCDNIGWKTIDFDKSKVAEMEGIRMLMILPHHPPIETYVKDELLLYASIRLSTTALRVSTKS